MDRPIEQAIRKYLADEPVRLHMPGHKGRLDFPPLSMDVTELAQTGNLFDDEGVFTASERCAAQVYHARGAAYSAGGSTLCIQAMLSYYLCGKRHILLQRSCHKSAATTAALLGLQPVWVTAEEPDALETEIRGVIGGVDAVFLTSPDYFGRCLPLESVACLCRERGIPLLVDAAHGAHFPAAGLPDPIAQGAAAACVSLHKTLPALTGSALTLTADPADAKAIKREMARFGSSSPSFPILLSGERAVAQLEESGPAWEALCIQCTQLRQRHRVLLPNDDFSKLWVRMTPAAVPAVQELMAQYRIVPELFDSTQLLMMVTPQNTADELERVDRFLGALDGTLDGIPAAVRTSPAPPVPRQALGPGEAFRAAKERIALEYAVGRVCAEVANVCPPCACLLCYGEEIDAAAVNFLQTYGISSVDVVK